MALQKSKTLASGVTGDYWKIIKTTVDKMNMTAEFQMELFLNEAHKSAKPLYCKKTFTFTIVGSDLNENIILLGYTKIKAFINSIIKEEVIADPDNNIAGVPAVYGDMDLHGATDI